MTTDQSASTTVDAYIAAFPPDVQAILQQIRQVIHEAVPNLGETISNGMPTFALNGKYLVYIAAYKKHIGLYPAPTGVEEFQEAVSQYGAGKGTLKFPLDQASPTCASASSNNRRASSGSTMLAARHPARAQRRSMDNPQLSHVPVMKTGMLIRRPVAEVFEAFVNPDITTQFWFTRSSGRLESGKQVEWAWEMYDVSAVVTVQAIEPNTRIVMEWPGYSGLTTVEWLFTPHTDDTTFVTITETGFTGDGDNLVQQVTASTQGFSLVLAGLKALLEHNVRLNLVADRYPRGLEAP